MPVVNGPVGLWQMLFSLQGAGLSPHLSTKAPVAFPMESASESGLSRVVLCSSCSFFAADIPLLGCFPLFPLLLL